MNRFSAPQFSRRVRQRIEANAIRFAQATAQLRLHRSWYTVFSVLTICTLVLSGVLSGAFVRITNAGNTNVLVNGGFENGFTSQAGCGTVGQSWTCFTNGSGANYGFYDEQWSPVLAEGVHGQLIEINTRGIAAPDHDRVAGIYQTVRVVDWANYTLNLRGMVRTTIMDGDPNRYKVEVGWTAGRSADVNAVKNWQDTGWYNYYERTLPGAIQSYSTQIMAEADYITVYIRVLKKWGIADEEIDINLDAITLTGPAVGSQLPGGTIPTSSGQAAGSPSCANTELVFNGGFEQGFAPLAYGLVGRGWGNFTNGGAAGYGFYDEQWPPVVAAGTHGQLIEINGKGIANPDLDRYAGISQQIRGLSVGATYELTIRGQLRGANEDVDPDRYVAQWGWNPDGDNDWTRVKTWTAMDLGAIYDRLNPGPMGTYKVQFKAPHPSIVLFIRGWKKWSVTEAEMDFNLDEISLRRCNAPVGPVSPLPPPPPVGRVCLYYVQSGDTLGWIAQQYGVSLWDLAYINGIANYDWIYVGQPLTIPGCNGAPPPPPVYVPPPPVYVPPPPIHVPPPVHLPAPAPCDCYAPPPPTRRTHIVAAGETLGYLCELYGVDVWTIAEVNGLSDPNFIYVGQVLEIP